MLKRARIIFSFLALTVMVGCVGTSEGRTAGISVSPSSATAGTPSETITISGTDFAPTSTILVNGSPRATNYISGTKLSTALTSTDLARPSVLSISVASSSSWSVTPLKTRSGTRQKTTTEEGTFTVLSSSLQILTSSLPAGVIQAPYSASLAARGGVAPTAWKVTAGQLPAGINLVASTGALSGMPTQAGTASFSVGITDSSSPPQTATQLLTLSASAVAAPLSINFSAFPGGITQTSYASTASATGGMTPYAWSVASGSLPTGLSLNASSGVIAGTPTTTGTFNFSLQVRDSSPIAQTASVTASILIVAPLKITTTSLPAPQLQKSYSVTLATSGGMAPYVWSVASGALPTGLSLNSSTGVISGTPTTAGTYAFTLNVNDPPSLPQNASQAFSATVSASAAPLQITTTNLPSGQVKTAYNATFVASGGTIPYTWAVTSGALPTPLALSASTGQISGTPTTAGAFNLTVQVKDSAGQSSSANFAINIASQPTLSIVTASLPGGTVGASYAGTLQATGGTQPYNWSIASGQLPGGLVLNASSGVLSGTPTVNGSFPFTVQVADATSQGASVGLIMTIASAPSGLAPSMYTSRTDVNAAPETVPTECSPAPCQMTSSDLNPNVQYTRVTDANTRPDRSGDTYATDGSAEQLTWNSNSTNFYAVTLDSGFGIPFSLNTSTGVTSRIPCSFSGTDCSSNTYGGLVFLSISSSDMPYSLVSPYVVYGFSGSLLKKVDYTATVSNPATADTVTTLTDASTCPSVPSVNDPLDTSVGSSDTRFSATMGTGQDNDNVIFIYDTVQGCRWLNTATGTTGGNWGPTGTITYHDENGNVITYTDESSVHNSRISPDGTWVNITIEGSPAYNDFWQVATNNIYRCLPDPNGYCDGHQTLGYNGIFLNGLYGNSGPIYRHAFPTALPYAIPVTSQPTGFGYSSDTHLSWNNASASANMPVLASNFQGPPAPAPTIAWQDELVMYSTDATTNTAWREAHMYTRASSFNAEGMGNISPNGKWAIFTSDWGGSARTDVFLVPLR